MFLPRGLALSFLVLAAACGGDDAAGADAGGDCPTTGRYMELVTGASWTYRVVTSSTGEKTQTVGDLEDVGDLHAGVIAFRVTTTKPGGGEVISWQEDTGEGVRRYREQDNAGMNTTDELYTPFRTRIDESAAHLVEGATWTEDYTEDVTEISGTPPMTTMTTTDKTETWSVVAVDEVTTVPAGDFCTLHLRRISSVGGVDGSDKSYWFARGVGKIKEVSAGQTETLTAYTLP